MQLDENLQQSYIYKSFRDKASIAPVNVHLVSPGTFSQFRLNSIDDEKATPNQFKVPRVIRRPEAVQFMESRTIK